MAINNIGWYPTPGQPTAYPIQQTFSNTPISFNQQHNNGIIWVQGESGAKAYPVEPRNSVLLMDSEKDCFYIKSTDSSGVPMPLRTFMYSEVVQQPVRQVEAPSNDQQYITREEFEEFKRMIQERQPRRNQNGEQAFSRNSKQQPNE